MKETFTGRIRAAAQEMEEPSEYIGFTVDQLCELAMIQTYADKKKVRNVVADLCKAGELARVGEGIYRLVQKTPGKPQLQEVMWRVLRARRTVTVEDMELMAGASAAYSVEWLRMLERRKIVRHLKNDNWQMVTDPGPVMPMNDEKAARLRRMRAKKKEALDAMDRAFMAIAEARMAMSEMGE